MIRIVTLSEGDGANGTDSTTRLQELTDQLSLAEIDVVCCQGMQRTLDGSKDPARKIAESLQMTYSFSAADCGKKVGPKEKETSIKGLSILAGAHVWMLNSGSFLLPSDHPCKKQVAQFAVIRQNGNSVLVLNTELAPSVSVQLQQLRVIFSHQLLQEQYGAVVLCSNGTTAVSPREVQLATALSAYKLADETTVSNPDEHKTAPIISSCPPGKPQHLAEGVILTLLSRKPDTTSAAIHCSAIVFRPTSVLTTEIEFKRIPPGGRSKLFFPLSFSEQRLEFKESFRGLAITTP